MKKIKQIDLGEYIIDIVYDKSTGELDLSISDELGDIIESINICNDNDDINPQLN